MQKLIAFWAGKRLQFVRENPSQCQKKVFKNLIKKLSRTRFGRDHRVSSGMTVHEFQKAVPIFEYEDYAPYLELLKTGEKNILWPGVMECFCLSSGTTSGEKKIPIYSSAVYAILKTSFFQLMFLCLNRKFIIFLSEKFFTCMA